MRKEIGVGAGVGLGAIVALPATAQADDFTVTNLNDSGAGSLREAIEDANADALEDRILFKSKLSGTIQWEGSDPDIYTGDLEIVGPGARKLTVSAVENGRAFVVLADPYGAPDVDVNISGLTLSGGDTGYNGGGLMAYGDVDLTLSRVTVSGNSAEGDGGGVAINTYGNEASLRIERSTVSGNASSDDGGGIYGLGADVSVVDSTISGNRAEDFGGGAGVFGSFAINEPNFSVTNSTVTTNTAESGGGLAAAPFVEDATRFDIVGSIVARNLVSADHPDLEFGPFDTAFSLIGDPGDAMDDEGGNILGADPNLKPLKDNGGPTDTHAFKKSPAKNKIPKGQTPKNDQRGAKRKGKGDIGAYELTKCKGVVVNFVGTSGKDKLKGTKKKDGMLGLGGNDRLKGKKGKDGLCGGRGKDKLIGGPGVDKFNGGPGKDKEIQ